MHVAHIINNLPIGGAERFLVQLAVAEQALGFGVSVLTLTEPNVLAAELSASAVPHVCMQRRRLNDPRVMLDLIRTLRELSPAVVHTHLFYADVFGRPAACLARVPAIVTTEHSTEAGPLSRKRRAGMRATARLAQRIVAVSPAVRVAAAARLGIDAKHIEVIPNGIDVDTCARATPASRRALDIPEGPVVIGCVGRLVDSKGYASLLDAMARLKDLPVHLLVVGDGPDRQRLEERAGFLGIGSRTTWLGFRNDVANILKTIDIFAMPSFWEGHSIALLEAMAAGRACVVSDIPELTETLGDAGGRVIAGNVESIEQGLRRLVTSPNERARLGVAAAARAQQFSIDLTARRYADLYASVLDAGRGRWRPA